MDHVTSTLTEASDDDYDNYKLNSSARDDESDQEDASNNFDNDWEDEDSLALPWHLMTHTRLCRAHSQIAAMMPMLRQMSHHAWR